MADYKKQLEEISEKVQQKKIEKVKLEERQRKLQEEKEANLKELKALGIDEKEIVAWLKKAEAEIQEGIGKCNTILN